MGDGTGGVTPDLIKPNVSAPNISDVKSVLAPGTNFEFSWTMDSMSEEEIEYSWPWVIVDGEYLDAANKLFDSSYAQLFGTFTARAGDVLCLDYKINTEASYDIFYIVIDGVIAQQISGYKQNWTTCYAYIFDEHMEGTHSIGLIYNRDGQLGSTEGVQIKNMRFERFENLSDVEFDYVYHQGGEVLNPEGSATQFKYYATPVYNEEDSYYHVGSKDGPILFANLMNVSAWSKTSVWLLAYNDYIVYDGFNYKSMFEEYAWQANNNMTNYGYTPVTEELRYLLDIACRTVDVYKVWDGEYHANEWLELCAYYAHYGMSEPFADPMKTITYQGAVELFEGVDNTVSVPFAINPRGFKYKFIPSETAVYNIYSKEIDGATVVTDPECWLMQLDEYGNENFLGYYTDLVYAEMIEDENGMEVMNGHFNFHHVLNAGETYYILCTTFLDTAAVYDVRIEKVGPTYTYMENAAVGPYSFNEATSELLIPNAINFAYSDPEEGGDGYYHYLNEDGTLGSIIYLDAVRPTAFFNSNDLYSICMDARSYVPEKRAFYINGVDYTDALTNYCFQAKQRTGQYAGFMEVDQALYDILTAITVSSKYEGTFNSWLMLCYYEKTLSV